MTTHSSPLVFFAYALVTQDSATLFVNEKQITADVKKHLGDHVTIRPYEDIFSDIDTAKKSFSANGEDFKVRICGPCYMFPFMDCFPLGLTWEASELGSRQRNWEGIISILSWNLNGRLLNTLSTQENIIISLSPIAEAKAIKNDVETEGFRQSHIRDGAALVRILPDVGLERSTDSKIATGSILRLA